MSNSRLMSLVRYRFCSCQAHIKVGIDYQMYNQEANVSHLLSVSWGTFYRFYLPSAYQNVFPFRSLNDDQIFGFSLLLSGLWIPHYSNTFQKLVYSFLIPLRLHGTEMFEKDLISLIRYLKNLRWKISIFLLLQSKIDNSWNFEILFVIDYHLTLNII